MTEAGHRRIEAAKADGSWTLLDDVEDLTVPPDLAQALITREGGQEGWDAWPDSVKKPALWQIKSAKHPGTRARRIETFADAAAAGRRPF